MEARGLLGASALGHSLGSNSGGSGMGWMGWHPSFLPQASGFATLVLARGRAGVQGTRGSPQLQE